MTKQHAILTIPSPLAIAVGLTFFTILCAWLGTQPADTTLVSYFPDVLGFWQQGVWSLLTFAMQMMLMLCLGYVLALSPVIGRGIDKLVATCHTNAHAICLICLTTMLLALFNWGLGMVFGAIIARKFGEHFSKHQIPYNYPLMGAAGYSGLMVWHGGLSGSAPLKVAEEGHFLADTMGVMPISETIFSNMNLVTTAVMLIVLPSFAYWLAKRSQTKQVPLSFFQQQTSNHKVAEDKPVQWQFIAVTFGAMILLLALSSIFSDTQAFYKKITPNFINLLLFGLCILFHGNYNRFLAAVDEAISSTSGIMIQFPLYGGIMGIMKFSGLMAMISEAFTAISSDVTFPLFTLVSAAIVNVFVPSGGGQWAVQGPIIVEAASNLNVSISKSVMALAYGDQLTNMIQPFWALPLLGITALKPQQLIPYTALFMLVGMVIFMGALLVF